MSKLEAGRPNRSASAWPVRQALHASTALILAMVLGAGAAQAQVSPQVCGEIFNRSYGPFDYRKAGKFEKGLVERAHFTPEVEALLHYKTNNSVGPVLSYTLNVFPNHHRALVAAVRLTEKDGTDAPKGLRTIECYFERALRFASDDLIVQALYVTWLIKKKRTGEAEARLDQLVAKAGDNPNLHYTTGLLYLQLEMYDRALQQAHRAEELGWRQTELADKLRAKDQWRERPVPPRTP